MIRATSLSGVANHYVSISPGPNSEPALGEGAEIGLGSTTTPIVSATMKSPGSSSAAGLT